jgi:hypothetical protein
MEKGVGLGLSTHLGTGGSIECDLTMNCHDVGLKQCWYDTSVQIRMRTTELAGNKHLCRWCHG